MGAKWGDFSVWAFFPEFRFGAVFQKVQIWGNQTFNIYSKVLCVCFFNWKDSYATEACLWAQDPLSLMEWWWGLPAEKRHMFAENSGRGKKGSASCKCGLGRQHLGFSWRGLLNLGQTTKTLSPVRLCQE